MQTPFPHVKVELETVQQLRKSWLAHQHNNNNKRMTEDCPESLKVLVKFYRCLGQTFTGMVFRSSSNTEDEVEERRNNSVSEINKRVKKENLRCGEKEEIEETEQNCNSFHRNSLLIVYQVFILVTFSAPFWLEMVNDRRLAANETDLIEVGIRRYQRGFTDLKPILRAIMQWVIYVFIIENMFTYANNLFYGGQLIVAISRLARLLRVEVNGKRSISSSISSAAPPPPLHQLTRPAGVRMLKLQVGAVVLMNVFSVAFFNADRIFQQVSRWMPSSQTHNIHQHQNQTSSDIIDQEESIRPMSPLFRSLTIRLPALLLIYSSLYTALSTVPVLFIYSMLLLRDYIRSIEGRVRQNNRRNRLNEEALLALRDQLLIASVHFQAILRRLSFSLTTLLVSNIYLLIASTCYLMVSGEGHHHHHQQQHQSGDNHRFISTLLLNFGLFGFIRLLVVCCTGNLVTNEHQQLGKC